MDRVNKLKALAQRFRELHHRPGKLLVLPNAWDGGSAVLFERAGAEAVASTSAGCAYAHGFPDGEEVTYEDILQSAKSIARRVNVPVSVDLESGFGDTPAQVCQSVSRVILEGGAIGFNIEDSKPGPDIFNLYTKEEQVERLAALNKLREEIGVPFVINARTDAAWKVSEKSLAEAIDRGNAYLASGADCIFVPGVTKAADIATLVNGIKGPINILAVESAPSLDELEKLGVARCSVGSGPARAALTTTKMLAEKLLKERNCSLMFGSTLSHAECQEIFAKKSNIQRDSSIPQML